MNVIRCKNGHFFDGDSYDKCPHCGESVVSAGGGFVQKEEKKGFWGRTKKDKEPVARPIIPTTQTTNNRVDMGDTPTDVVAIENMNKPAASAKNPTLDFWQSSVSEGVVEDMNQGAAQENSIVVENPIEVGDKPENAPVKAAPVVPSLKEVVKNASANNEGKTMSYFSAATSGAASDGKPKRSVDPVVGWLVCIGGCHIGQGFEIFAGKNTIGRSAENRVVIPDDNSISRMKHALIVYEPKKRNFYIQPGDSSGLTYLNDDYITESKMISSHDTIELGDSKFIFVPLCGESFSWEEYMPKGE